MLRARRQSIGSFSAELETRVEPGRAGSAGEGGEHLLGVLVRLDAAHDPGDVAVRVDHEGRALEAVRALLRHAVGLAGGLLRVGEERERQPVLLLEARGRGLRVGADAEDDGACLAEARVLVADPARLLRAAGRVVARVEVEDDRAAAKAGEPDEVAGVARELEVRCRCALFHHSPRAYLATGTRRGPAGKRQ